MEYYVEIINVLSALCEGENHLTESDCQELLTLDDLIPVALAKMVPYSIRAAYLNFLAQVHYNTEQANSEVHLSDETWGLLDHIKNELWKGVDSKFEDKQEEDFIFGSIMKLLVSFFETDFSQLPPLTKYVLM